MPYALVHAYPWDLEDDPAAAQRAVDLGVDAVAVAASYHATRAAGPLRTQRPLVDAAHAACYVPVRRSAWAGRRLVPRAPTWVSSPDSFGAARDVLARAGLQTCAWVVLTHNSALGAAHPDLVVRNAFGDGYPYALCPSAPDVVEYCVTLVAEVLAAGPVDGLVLEACGPMGFEHNGVHEKTALAGWTAVQRSLLSLCFCAACSSRCADAGLDVAETRRRVRAAVVPGDRPAPASVEAALGSELAASLQAVRAAATRQLRGQVVEQARARPGVRVTLHADPDPWATGSFPALVPPLTEEVDAVVTSCFDVPAGAQALAALRAGAARSVALGGLLRPASDDSDEDVDAVAAQLRAAGLDELHLYHLGLVGAAGLAQLRRTVAAYRRGLASAGGS